MPFNEGLEIGRQIALGAANANIGQGALLGELPQGALRQLEDLRGLGRGEQLHGRSPPAHAEILPHRLAGLLPDDAKPGPEQQAGKHQAKQKAGNEGFQDVHDAGSGGRVPLASV
jgi:hypothetical protein